MADEDQVDLYGDLVTATGEEGDLLLKTQVVEVNLGCLQRQTYSFAWCVQRLFDAYAVEGQSAAARS